MGYVSFATKMQNVSTIFNNLIVVIDVVVVVVMVAANANANTN